MGTLSSFLHVRAPRFLNQISFKEKITLKVLGIGLTAISFNTEVHALDYGTQTINSSPNVSGDVGNADIVSGGNTLTVGSSSAFSSAAITQNAPGGSLTIQNNATLDGFGHFNYDTTVFEPSSTFILGIYAGDPNPGANFRFNNVQINSLASISPTLFVYAEPGTYGTATTFALGSFVEGTFGPLQTNGLVEIVNVDYNYSGQGLAVTVRDASTTIPVNIPTADVGSLATNIGQHGLDRAAIGDVDDFMPQLTFRPASTRNPLKSRTSFSKAMAIMSQQQKPFIIEKNHQRFWVTPYYIQGKTNLQVNGDSKDYNEGIMSGYQRSFWKDTATFGGTVGLGMGQQYTPTAFGMDNRVNSKFLFLGAYHSLKFLESGRYDFNITGGLGRHDALRNGNPAPNVFYQANGDFSSKSLSANLLGSWLFKLPYNYSFRPSVGFTMGYNALAGYTENNAGTFNQVYGRKVTRSREPYVGVGLRKRWDTKDYVFKLTGILEHGYEFGDDRTNSRVSLQTNTTSGFEVNNRGYGRHANYLTVYGSALDTKINLKFYLTYAGTLKRFRTVHAISLKTEYRW
jgi:hypothetical protein